MILWHRATVEPCFHQVVGQVRALQDLAIQGHSLVSRCIVKSNPALVFVSVDDWVMRQVPYTVVLSL